ncbi:hypothetical protein ATANTOWER_023268, partial [Ataeniobius toweri]|nr:hypothetical protein [Ataeniobius toweri]
WIYPKVTDLNFPGLGSMSEFLFGFEVLHCAYSTESLLQLPGTCMLRKVLTTSPVNWPGILLPVHPPTVHIATRTKNKENLNRYTLLKTPSLLNRFPDA